MNPISASVTDEITNRRLSDIRSTLKIDWYRCPIDRDRLKTLSQRSNWLASFQTAGHLGLLLITGITTWSLFEQDNWAGFLLALFAYGSVASFLSAPHHEFCHGSVFKSRRLNELFLRLFSTLGWLNFYVYKFSHSYHHRYTLHIEGDREEVMPAAPSLRFWFLLQLFSINFSGGYQARGILPTIQNVTRLALDRFDNPFNSWGPELYAEHDTERRKARNWARWLLAFHASVFVIATSLGHPVVALIVSGGPFIGGTWRYFVAVPQHCGLQSGVADFRKCTRSVALDPLSAFLYWHMNWHLEHHMYANVPCYHLKALHQSVAGDMPKLRTLTGAWREMRETWKRQQSDPHYAFDTPVPPPANKKTEQSDLAHSIGDLAPADIADA